MSTDVLERPDVKNTGTDDREKVVHYIKRNEILESVVDGKFVRTLCGEILQVTKTAKDGSPVCEKCKEIFAELPK
ncbi:hypothetical protein SEA_BRUTONGASTER_65 [Gordonia phage BrutonGaster]|uniref:DUF3039 domain-containing protein n=1 Tax=Gordonia phage BrutonGaster TaxID=2530116 RepID=A0A482JKH0_9CAUD|nr:hypothetical protein HOV26_gp117 [Gordonia phage BrutonGaster]QBP33282.1 hypothetical protein SEA_BRUTONGASTER_65 [Gordonia phage BrutonGaster]